MLCLFCKFTVYKPSEYSLSFIIFFIGNGNKSDPTNVVANVLADFQSWSTVCQRSGHPDVGDVGGTPVV